MLVTALVVALVLAAFVLFAAILRRSLISQYERQALGVAQATAARPMLGEDVAAERSAPVQRDALAVQRATGALFVVITDDQGIRLAHPNPAEIGHKVSTDPSGPLSGRAVANMEVGTLGLSVRGKVPLRDAKGSIVGEVSVGFDASDINDRMLQLLGQAAVFVVIALLAGLVGAALIGRLLKRRTRGIEPEQLTELVREREAVLHGIREGVIGIDADGNVTSVNPAARELLGGAELPERVRRAIATGDVNNEFAVAGERALVFSYRRVVSDSDDLGGVVSMRDRTDLQSLASELDSIRTMTDSLRAQRHEYANRMHTLTGLLAAGHSDEALEYLRGIHAVDTVAEEQRVDAIASATIRAFMAAKTAAAAERGVLLRLSETSFLPMKLRTPVETVTVLGNLVDNAIEAASRAIDAASTGIEAASGGVDAARTPTVEVDVLADGRDLLLYVADSGPGIPPDKIDFVFTEGVSGRGAGHGFGLATAKQVAISLGGDVWIASAANPGEQLPGAVLAARLPGILDPEKTLLDPKISTGEQPTTPRAGNGGVRP